MDFSENASLVIAKLLLLPLHDLDERRQTPQLLSCYLSELEGSHNQGTVGVPVGAAMRSCEGPEVLAAC